MTWVLILTLLTANGYRTVEGFRAPSSAACFEEAARWAEALDLPPSERVAQIACVAKERTS